MELYPLAYYERLGGKVEKISIIKKRIGGAYYDCRLTIGSREYEGVVFYGKKKSYISDICSCVKDGRKLKDNAALSDFMNEIKNNDNKDAVNSWYFYLLSMLSGLLLIFSIGVLLFGYVRFFMLLMTTKFFTCIFCSICFFVAYLIVKKARYSYFGNTM